MNRSLPLYSILLLFLTAFVTTSFERVPRKPSSKKTTRQFHKKRLQKRFYRLQNRLQKTTSTKQKQRIKHRLRQLGQTQTSPIQQRAVWSFGLAIGSTALGIFIMILLNSLVLGWNILFLWPVLLLAVLMITICLTLQIVALAMSANVLGKFDKEVDPIDAKNFAIAGLICSIVGILVLAYFVVAGIVA